SRWAGIAGIHLPFSRAWSAESVETTGFRTLPDARIPNGRTLALLYRRRGHRASAFTPLGGDPAGYEALRHPDRSGARHFAWRAARHRQDDQAQPRAGL